MLCRISWTKSVLPVWSISLEWNSLPLDKVIIYLSWFCTRVSIIKCNNKELSYINNGKKAIPWKWLISQCFKLLLTNITPIRKRKKKETKKPSQSVILLNSFDVDLKTVCKTLTNLYWRQVLNYLINKTVRNLVFVVKKREGDLICL